MVKIKKSKLGGAEIPTGSMADISFLLLLFFLVSTVIDVDTGIGLTLPPYQEEQEVAPLSKDRMAALLINENGDVLLNKEQISIPQIEEIIAERLREKIDAPSNKKLVVSVKTDRNTNYNLFVQALDQVRLAYSQVRNEWSQANHNVPAEDLNEEAQKVMKDKIPMTISIAEPEQVNK